MTTVRYRRGKSTPLVVNSAEELAPLTDERSTARPTATGRPTPAGS